jgi:tight adherence protein C
MFELFVALLAGLAIFVLVVGLLSPPRIDPVQARLTSLTSGGPIQSLEELELERPIFERTLQPFLGRMTGLAQRLASPARVSRTDRRLAMAGYPGGMRTIDFLGLKVLLAAVGAIAGFVILGVLGRSPLIGIIVAAALAGLGYVGLEFWLSRAVRARQHQILLAIPDTLDLLTISVRAGLGFDGALAKVVEKTRGPLADEFSRALAEIRVGRPRRDALRDVVERTEVPGLTAFVGAIIQAEQLGVPIAKVLQVQSEQLRIERRQRAEEMANTAPIKMLFPLVGCIFPSMFIVILGPAVILVLLNLTPLTH